MHDHAPDLPPVRRILADAPTTAPTAELRLGYDDRLVRRKRLVTTAGAGFLIDLPETTSLDGVYGLELEDGTVVRLLPADEALLEITGDLPRLAWHIGNRHTPCQIGPGHLRIREDHVLEAMLRQLGATITRVTGPFVPEGGAYGHGRTMGHDHGTPHVHHHSSHGGGEDTDEDEAEA